jgi:hypothetical protein
MATLDDSSKNTARNIRTVAGGVAQLGSSRVLPGPPGYEARLVPTYPGGVGRLGLPCRDDRTVTGCCTLPREPASAWGPASLGNILLRMVVNVVGRFVSDAHHRGVLWKLPERVVDSIPLLGLEYLLDGSPYNLDTVKQLLQTQKEYDWLNWGQKGYH